MELSQFKTVEQLAAAIKSLDMVTSVPWTDYSGISTIVGWSSATTGELSYKKIGKLVFVVFHLAGTSDDTATSFTVPFSNNADMRVNVIVRGLDDGSYNANTLCELPVSSNIVSFYTDLSGATWTASGSKTVIGQFFYEAA